MMEFSHPGRCSDCRLPTGLCVCAYAPRLDVSTRVVMLMHAREWKRSSNTGHLLRLALSHADVRLQGLKEQPLDASGLDPKDPRTLVLFPGCGARPLTAERLATLHRPVTLLVPDGNWSQARHMVLRLPFLRGVEVVSLPGPQSDVNRPRRNVFPDRMSTYEAVAQAIGLIEGPHIEDTLVDFLRRAVDRMMLLRGRLKAADVFGGVEVGALRQVTAAK